MPGIAQYNNYGYILSFNISVGLGVCMASTVSSALRQVLVLGSGFTSAPLVECLTRDGGIAVTVGMMHNNIQLIKELKLFNKQCDVIYFYYYKRSLKAPRSSFQQ